MKSNKYYSLAVKYENKWVIEFGSFDRNDVADAWTEEKKYWIDNGMRPPEMEMLITANSQRAVNAAINKLNKKG